MALGFSSGLLTGLQTAGQGGSMPSDPRDQNLLQKAGVTNPLLQQFGQGFGGMFGVDTRSQNEQMQGALQAIDPTASDATSQMEAALSKYGDPKTAAVVLESRIKREKDLAIRQALSAIDTSTVQGKRQYAAILARDPERAGEARQWMQEAQTQEQFVAGKRAERGLAAQAREYGVNEKLIAKFESGDLSKEALTEEIDSARDVKLASNLSKLRKEQQVQQQMKLATSIMGENLPPELVSEIEAGAYVDTSKDEGRNKEFLDDIKGRNVSNETYMDKTTGESFTLNTRWGSVYKNGEWKTPEELNLVKRTLSAQGQGGADIGITKPTAGQVTNTIGSVASLVNVVDALEGMTQTEVGGQIIASKLPISVSDESDMIRNANALTADTSARLVSGAAVKKDEQENFVDTFTITARDITNPTSVARKIRQSMVLMDTANKLQAGMITPEQARKTVYGAMRLDFTKAEKEMIKEGKYKAVLSQYYPAEMQEAKPGSVGRFQVQVIGE